MIVDWINGLYSIYLSPKSTSLWLYNKIVIFYDSYFLCPTIECLLSVRPLAERWIYSLVKPFNCAQKKLSEISVHFEYFVSFIRLFSILQWKMIWSHVSCHTTRPLKRRWDATTLDVEQRWRLFDGFSEKKKWKKNFSMISCTIISLFSAAKCRLYRATSQPSMTRRLRWH